MGEVTLSNAVRNNLLSLQQTADLLGKTQQRLSTGLKVNSALDDPTAFFTASSLNSRAGDLNRLLDSVGNAVQTVRAADQGISAITKLVESAQASARQALQKPGAVTPAVASTSTGSVAIADTAGTVSSGAIADDAAVAAFTGTLTITGTDGAYTIDFDGTSGTSGTEVLSEATLTAEIAAASAATGTTFAYAPAGTLDVTATGSETFDISGTHAGLGGAISNGTIAATNATVAGLTSLEVTVGSGTLQTIDTSSTTNQTDLLSTINGALTGATATIVSDNVVITADNTTDSLTLGGADATTLGLSSSAPTTGTTVNNSDRAALETEFNNVRTQIDQLASDASFNGINLLNGDSLSVIFNENGTSSLSVTGVTFDSSGLGVSAAATDAFQSNTSINASLTELDTAISSLRQQASTFGSNLSVVEVRQDFTKNLINTLETGAANLTLADTNEEGANLLALQTRQQLSSVALSLASQADQNVLRLF